MTGDYPEKCPCRGVRHAGLGAAVRHLQLDVRLTCWWTRVDPGGGSFFGPQSKLYAIGRTANAKKN